MSHTYDKWWVNGVLWWLYGLYDGMPPSGKRLRSFGKSSISMTIFSSYVKLPEGRYFRICQDDNECHAIDDDYISCAIISSIILIF